MVTLKREFAAGKESAGLQGGVVTQGVPKHARWVICLQEHGMIPHFCDMWRPFRYRRSMKEGRKFDRSEMHADEKEHGRCGRKLG